MRYAIYELGAPKRRGSSGGVTRQVDEVEAKSAAEAIRKHKASSRRYGNEAPSWVKFKAVKSNTLSIRESESGIKNPRPRIAVLKNTTGYKDARGVFHPERVANAGPHSIRKTKKRQTKPYTQGTTFDVVAERKPHLMARMGRNWKPLYDSKGRPIVKKAAKKNPAPAGFPVGKFVKVDAVKVNRNGTIDVMRSTSKRPKR